MLELFGFVVNFPLRLFLFGFFNIRLTVSTCSISALSSNKILLVSVLVLVAWNGYLTYALDSHDHHYDYANSYHEHDDSYSNKRHNHDYDYSENGHSHDHDHDYEYSEDGHSHDYAESYHDHY